MKKLLALIVLVWLLIGTAAAYQRDYFTDSETNCAEVGTIAVTIVTGPLNYTGLNPKVDDCPDADVDVPQPSE